MQNLDRTRLIFVAIIGLAVLIVGCGVAYSMLTRLINPSQATPSPQVASNPESTTKPLELTSPEPIYASGYKPRGDNLPVYLCSAEAVDAFNQGQADVVSAGGRIFTRPKTAAA